MYVVFITNLLYKINRVLILSIVIRIPIQLFFNYQTINVILSQSFHFLYEYRAIIIIIFNTDKSTTSLRLTNAVNNNLISLRFIEIIKTETSLNEYNKAQN